MSGQIYFQCVKECSSVCCGGATIITLSEIEKLYRYFPITIGFRKVYPVDQFHENYLKELTFKYRHFYIIGDFIAGNRLSKKCRLLKNSLCSIQGKLKPLQCIIIPFSITFPEEYQDKVIKEKRKGAFRNCRGFHESFPLIWNGRFLDNELRIKFNCLKDSVASQREFMEKIFSELVENPFFSKFIFSQDGLFEVPIDEKILREICSKTSIENTKDFIRNQKKLFVSDLTNKGVKNSLFTEALHILEKIRI